MLEIKKNAILNSFSYPCCNEESFPGPKETYLHYYYHLPFGALTEITTLIFKNI